MKVVCGAKTRSGKPCQKPPVQDGKRCRLHGGKGLRGADNPNFKTGIYSQWAKNSIREKTDHFLEAEPFDLVQEQALTRALLAEYLGRFEDGVPLDGGSIVLMSELIDRIRKTADTITKIKNDTALTGAEVTYLVVRATEVITRYIHDPAKQQAFIQDLFGGLAGADATIPGRVSGEG